MSLIDTQLEEYIETHSSKLDNILYQLERETQLKVLRPRMLSGRIQGKFLEFIVKMTGAKHILEIGTYTGYSALCMAAALPDDGQLYTIDINVEIESIARKYFHLSNLENKINFIIGDAMAILPQLSLSFDLVFIDADKINYSNYFDLIIDRLSSGAWIIADNVLWSGKVLHQITKKDRETKALQDFNDKIQHDNRIENLLLPLRDGLMIMRKL